MTTIVQATYYQNNIINVVQPPLYNQSLSNSSNNVAETLLVFPALMIWSTFVWSQGPYENVMGSKLVALLDSQNVSNFNYTLVLVRMDVARICNC